MMRCALPPARAPHLFCALIACALPVAILCGGRVVAARLEEKTIHETAPKDFFIKNQGLALQKAAARAPDVLLLYGSSELIDPVPNRASDFFASEKTGFQVCPVGKAGSTSLIVLQKLGALGSAVRDRKVAISVTPSSFFTQAVDPYAYAGNFSLPAASEILFGDALDFDLKAEIARRMLQFPDTLGRSALLQIAANRLASGRPWDRIALMLIEPLGKLQNFVFDLQDHFETLVYIASGGRGNHGSNRMRSGKTSTGAGRDHALIDSLNSGGLNTDAAFRSRILAATEWSDLELLLRTLTELHARPFIITMPIEGSFYDARGVSQSARDLYYERINDLAGRYHFPSIQFAHHDADPGFLLAYREHPTPQGWLYYDRALDDFFHDRNDKNEPLVSLRK